MTRSIHFVVLIAALTSAVPAAHAGATLEAWRDTHDTVEEICEWLFGRTERPRVGPVQVRETLVLDAEGRRALAELFRDQTLSVEDRARLGMELWTGRRLAQVDDPFDPILREVVAKLAVDWRDDASDLRASTHGIRWPRALRTPALIVACYAHALERLLQFYEFFGLTYGVALPRDQAWRDLWTDLFDVSTERTLERGGMGAEWEVLNATPPEVTGAEVEALNASALGELLRERYQFMFATGGLDFGRYLKLQYLSGRGTRREIMAHSIYKMRVIWRDRSVGF